MELNIFLTYSWIYYPCTPDLTFYQGSCGRRLFRLIDKEIRFLVGQVDFGGLDSLEGI